MIDTEEGWTKVEDPSGELHECAAPDVWTRTIMTQDTARTEYVCKGCLSQWNLLSPAGTLREG